MKARLVDGFWHDETQTAKRFDTCNDAEQCGAAVHRRLVAAQRARAGQRLESSLSAAIVTARQQRGACAG